MKKMMLICVFAALGGCTLGGMSGGSDESSSESTKSPQQASSGERAKFPTAREVFKILAVPKYESKSKPRECPTMVTLGGEMKRIGEIRDDLEALSKLVVEISDLELYLAHQNDDITKMSASSLELVNRYRQALLDIPRDGQAELLAEAQKEIDKKQAELIDQVAELEVELRSIALDVDENPCLKSLRRRANELEVDDVVYEKWKKHYSDAVSRQEYRKCAAISEPPPKDEINVLLVGRSGVGISTTINIIYNHLKSNPYGKRDVIIPLRTVDGVLEVNVDAFKTFDIKVKSSGRQTERVTQYSFSYGDKKITLVDVPGTMGNRIENGLSEKTIGAMIGQAIESLAISRILIVTDQKDINPVRVIGSSSFVYLKRMLPKAFSQRINGVYFGGRHNGDVKKHHQEKFSQLLGFPSGEFASLYVLDGKNFFEEPSDDVPAERLHRRNWLRDSEEVTNMFADFAS